MSFYLFKDDEINDYCVEIAKIIVAKFGIDESEAYNMIRAFWRKASKSSDNNLIQHEMPEFWADVIFSRMDSHDSIFLLMYGDTVVGFVTDISNSLPLNKGKFKYGVYGESFRERFKAILLEGDSDVEASCSNQLRDKSWSLIIELNSLDISMPIVYEDGIILFRWK